VLQKCVRQLIDKICYFFDFVIFGVFVRVFKFVILCYLFFNSKYSLPYLFFYNFAFIILHFFF